MISFYHIKNVVYITFIIKKHFIMCTLYIVNKTFVCNDKLNHPL